MGIYIMKQLEMKFEEEIWKDIPGYEGLYQASTFGRIKSNSRDRIGIKKIIYKTKEIILKQTLSKNYLMVKLYNKKN